MTRFLLFLVFPLALLAQVSKKDGQFVNEYPNLEKFTFKEPDSNFYLGYGFVPVGIIEKKTYFAANVFQIHYMDDFWDVEFFSASIGNISSNNRFAEANNFTFRTSPKVKLFRLLDKVDISIGGIFGYEYTRFKNVITQLTKNNVATTKGNLTGVGVIAGGVISETFDYGKGKIKLNQMVYNQSYSITEASDGWSHDYEDNEATTFENQQAMAANIVYVVEVNFLF